MLQTYKCGITVHKFVGYTLNNHSSAQFTGVVWLGGGGGGGGGEGQTSRIITSKLKNIDKYTNVRAFATPARPPLPIHTTPKHSNATNQVMDRLSMCYG